MIPPVKQTKNRKRGSIALWRFFCQVFNLLAGAPAAKFFGAAGKDSRERRIVSLRFIPYRRYRRCRMGARGEYGEER